MTDENDGRIYLTRDDVMAALRLDCERALLDASRSLTADRYDVTDGLWSDVRIRAIANGEKLGKYKQIGSAGNHRRWSDDP